MTRPLPLPLPRTLRTRQPLLHTAASLITLWYKSFTSSEAHTHLFIVIVYRDSLWAEKLLAQISLWRVSRTRRHGCAFIINYKYCLGPRFPRALPSGCRFIMYRHIFALIFSMLLDDIHENNTAHFHRQGYTPTDIELSLHWSLLSVMAYSLI